jgi:hypothetical protein
METQFPAEVIKDATIPNAWRVEKLDSDQDGGVDVTIFSGPSSAPAEIRPSLPGSLNRPLSRTDRPIRCRPD